MKKRIFIGSTKEGKKVAKALFALLSDKYHVRIWDHFLFEASNYTLEALESQITQFDFAILISLADDTIISRGTKQTSIRDNILIEIGLFVGKIGRKKTFIVLPRDKNIRIPTDLLGVGLVEYDFEEINDDFSNNLSVMQLASLKIEESISRYHNSNNKLSDYENLLSQKIVQIFDLAKEADDNKLILEIGEVLAESIWKRGFYDTLQSIGSSIENAASIEKNSIVQAKALIEYVGWIIACKGDSDLGLSYIEEGIKIAKELENFVWVSKGLRHIAAIKFHQEDYESCFVYLTDAQKAIDKIKDQNTKTTQLGPLYFGFTELSIKLEKIADVKRYFANTCLYYRLIGSEIKAVKIKAQEGKIHLLEGEYIKAKNCFNEGIQLSKKYNRNDELIRNLEGLEKAYLYLENLDEAVKCKKVYMKLKAKTPLLF